MQAMTTNPTLKNTIMGVEDIWWITELRGLKAKIECLLKQIAQIENSTIILVGSKTKNNF